MSEITCGIIRDLLPLYIDGLTSEETNKLIEEHLASCPECRAAYEAMRGGENTRADVPEEKEEIDFLKKNKKKNKMIVLFSILGALALAAAILVIRVFLIGNGDSYEWAPLMLTVNGKELTLTAVPTGSAEAVSRLHFTEENGVVTVSARTVLVSPLHKGSLEGSYTAQEEIREVRAAGRIVYADGATVSAQASELYATRHDYIGDMPANQKTANVLNIAGFLGRYTNELETKEEPYGWRIILLSEVNEEARAQKEQDMDAFGRILTGLIGNLDHVTFVYSTDGRQTERTITAEDASAFFGEDIKSCGESVRTLDRLIEKTGLTLYAMEFETREEEEEAVWLEMTNLTDTGLQVLDCGFYKDGVLKSSMSAMNADESPIKAGETLWFDVDAMCFGGMWDETETLELKFSFETPDGTLMEVQGSVRIAPTPGSISRFRIRGDAESGYVLVQ